MPKRLQAIPASLGPGFVSSVSITALDQALEAPGWEALVPVEQAHAAAASPRRAREFVAGRIALRAALAANEPHPDELLHACLPGEQGRPQLPAGWTGSITHKAGVAFAVAGRRSEGTLGVDSEVIGTRERLAIAPRVLRPGELARWQASGSVWVDLLRSFSVKEAIYKALHPWVPRYIGFHEAEIGPDGDIRMHLEGGEGPFVLTSSVQIDGDRLLSFVRARPG